MCTVKTHEIRVKMGQEGLQLRSCLKQMGDIPTTDQQIHNIFMEAGTVCVKLIRNFPQNGSEFSRTSLTSQALFTHPPILNTGFYTFKKSEMS